MSLPTTIFAIQDRSGTVAQLSTGGSENPVEVQDTGVYNGLSWNGTALALDFTVCQVNDPYNFCISTVTPTGAPGNVMQSGWPHTGTIDWLSGANVGESPSTEVVCDKFGERLLHRRVLFPILSVARLRFPGVAPRQYRGAPSSRRPTISISGIGLRASSSCSS